MAEGWRDSSKLKVSQYQDDPFWNLHAYGFDSQNPQIWLVPLLDKGGFQEADYSPEPGVEWAMAPAM